MKNGSIADLFNFSPNLKIILLLNGSNQIIVHRAKKSINVSLNLPRQITPIIKTTQKNYVPSIFLSDLFAKKPTKVRVVSHTQG